MKKIAIIPARYGSTRFPGKPLAKILGKEMILWVAERASQASELNDVVVATDDERVFSVVRSAGHRAQMTKANHPSGTDRIFEAAIQMGLGEQDVVINVQGDEPLVESSWISKLLAPFSRGAQMTTLAHSITLDEVQSLNSVKVLVDQAGRAIYFSRFPVPFSRRQAGDFQRWPSVFKHMGFYGYRMNFLARYCQAAPSFLEEAESLEQLRALELGAAIQVEMITGQSWGVDTPEDIAKIEKILGAV